MRKNLLNDIEIALLKEELKEDAILKGYGIEISSTEFIEFLDCIFIESANKERYLEREARNE